MSAKGLLGGALIVAAVVGGCHSIGGDTERTASTSPVTAPSSLPTSVAVPAWASAPGAGGTGSTTSGTTGHVARVIDGDSFALDNGDEVRVLGIDSCEMSSDEGPAAKSAAQGFLSGG